MSDKGSFTLKNFDLIDGEMTIKVVDKAEALADKGNIDPADFPPVVTEEFVVRFDAEGKLTGIFDVPGTGQTIVMLRAKVPVVSDEKLVALKAWLESIGGYIDEDEMVFPAKVNLPKGGE